MMVWEERYYNIPHENAEYEGGKNGTGVQQDYVTIVVKQGTNKLIIAFPSSGTYGVK